MKLCTSSTHTNTHLVSNKTKVIFQNVEDTRHLRENQDSRSLFLQLDQKLVQQHHLATVLPNMGSILVCQQRKQVLGNGWMTMKIDPCHKTLYCYLQGGPSSAPSNRYGWLQTFRSCMSTFKRRTRAGPPNMLSSWASFCSTFTYQSCCMGVRPM